MKQRQERLQSNASSIQDIQRLQGDSGAPNLTTDHDRSDPQGAQEPSGAPDSQNQRVSKRSQKSVEQDIPQQIQQQFKILNIDKNDHYGLICHLFPRLSESNLYFHDLYWLWSPSENSFKIRKRKVKFCRIIKVHGIGPQQFNTGFDVRFYLFDKRNVTGRQIVSNVITDKVRVDLSDSFSFFKVCYFSKICNLKNTFRAITVPLF